ncbi:hypothetical protein B0H66DRAFT_531839 [Apodospora peruviana]|uniref:Uncharacterized protein n=1 Tax=Apodospora peruviana TaxID=516989 RepID=A0AAE0ICM1_9PEZI|nr:hypothetical protein B0H66DRAFT_531839 [Apodospora peruviana]
MCAWTLDPMQQAYMHLSKMALWISSVEASPSSIASTAGKASYCNACCEGGGQDTKDVKASESTYSTCICWASCALKKNISPLPSKEKRNPNPQTGGPGAVREFSIATVQQPSSSLLPSLAQSTKQPGSHGNGNVEEEEYDAQIPLYFRRGVGVCVKKDDACRCSLADSLTYRTPPPAPKGSSSPQEVSREDLQCRAEWLRSTPDDDGDSLHPATLLPSRNERRRPLLEITIPNVKDPHTATSPHSWVTLVPGGGKPCGQRCVAGDEKAIGRVCSRSVGRGVG